MDKKINIWAYIRISSLEQKKNGHGKDLQLDKIKKFIEYNADKWYVYDEEFVYKDLGISGSKDENERPWLKRMKEDIKSGKIQAVVVYRLDRLARNTKVLLSLIEEFNKHGIIFMSVNENIETTTANGLFFITMLGAIATLERTNNSEKMTAWKMEAVKKWIFAIWGNPPYGYRKNHETKRLEIDPEQKEVVLEIFDLYVNQNKSISEIGKILYSRGIGTSYETKLKKERITPWRKWKWSPAQLSRIIWSEAYTGQLWVNKTITEEYTAISPETGKEIKKKRQVERPKEEWLLMEVEPIIEKKLFLKAQEKLITNKYRFNNNNKPIIRHLFAWLTKCWVCWANYKAYRERDKSWEHKVYYRCGHGHSLKYGEERCRNSQVRETELIEGTFGHIDRFIKNPKNIIEEYLKENTDKNEAEKYKKEQEKNSLQIREIYSIVDELFDSLISERNTKFKEMIQKKIDTHRWGIEVLEKRNTELSELIKSQLDKVENSKEVLRFSEKMKGKDIYSFTREEQIDLINLLIKKIVINADNIDVYYVFEDDEWWWDDDRDNPEIDPKDKEKGLIPHDEKLNLTPVSKMVARSGIEPPTQGFSGLCSTTELPRHGVWCGGIIKRFLKKQVFICLIFRILEVLLLSSL